MSSAMPVPTALASASIAGRVGRHQPGHAESGIRAEGEGVEEVVIDAAVDHVDAFQALGGAHEHLIVLDDEVASLDQLDAELVGEERVLVIGGIVDAGRHQRDCRLGRGAERGHRPQAPTAIRPDISPPARRDGGRTGPETAAS